MKEPVATKVESKLLARARGLTVNSKNPYAPSLAQLFERSLELGCNELEELERRKKPDK